MKAVALLLIVASSMIVAMDAGPAIACASDGDGCGDGPTLDWDQPYYMPGELATGIGYGLWSNKHREPGTGPEDGPFNMYLRPGKNLEEPADTDPLAILVGQLQTEEKNQTGHANFTVPQVDTGSYYVTICNIGCNRSIGYLSSIPVEIIANEHDERLYLTDRMNEISSLTYRMSSRSARGDWKLRKQIREGLDLEGGYRRDVSDDLDALEAELVRLKKELAQEPAPDQRLSLFSAGSASLLAGLALWRRRRDQPADQDAPCSSGMT